MSKKKPRSERPSKPNKTEKPKRESQKRALLIGINRYQIPGSNLRGCVNDVIKMRHVLTSHLGFAEAQIEVLTDLDATKARIEAGIKNLLKGAKPGDVLYLHYSGHGANVPDDDGDEADSRDEILCPTDLDWKDTLRDDWLRRVIDKNLPKQGANLTIVMDCCHSGSNTRAFAPPDAPIVNRYLPNPWDIMAEESGRKLRGKVARPRKLKPEKKRGVTDIAVADMPEVLITGCRDYQVSADALIDGTYVGALTYFLAKVITEANGKLTYRELHDKTLKLLAAARYEQVPQLEGRTANLDLPLLGIGAK